MALKDTTNHLRDLLANITADLEKAEGGNKAASQRVRTGTVRLEKVAKIYRKESIASERQPKSSKKSSSAAKKGGAKSSSGKAPAKSNSKSAAGSSAKVKAKPKAKQATARPRALSVKRPTAKLPSKSFSLR